MEEVANFDKLVYLLILSCLSIFRDVKESSVFEMIAHGRIMVSVQDKLARSNSNPLVLKLKASNIGQLVP